jgi:large subunit ribosomal protein L9
MEIILKQDVKNLGYKDELVKVKPGYARNFLIPRGLAISADASKKRELTETLKQRAHKEEKIRTAAKEVAASLESKTIKVGAKIGESGKIFGSVNAIMLADAIAKLGITVERKNITMDADAIKGLGTYNATVRLHKDVIAKITFEVVEE